MSCGCGNYNPPIVNPSTCESEYNICKNSPFNIDINYTCNNLNINYISPINGTIELIENVFIYTPNLDYIGTDTFTYDIYCNNIKIKTCTVTIVVEERDETTHTIELDACCNTVFIGEIISTNTISISEIKINNLLINTINYGNNSSAEIQSLLEIYLSNNGIVGDVVVIYDSVNYKYKFTISVKGETITTISIKNTANTVINLNKTQCGCLVGNVTYNWIFPENTTYVSLSEDSRITDCKIKVVLANDVAGSTIEDRTIKVEICCGACTDNCCKIEEWIYNPPTYGTNCEPICNYPCTTYNPITGNCDYICDDCQNCCEGTNGSYYCANCCTNDTCSVPDCPNDNRICDNGNCYCVLLDGSIIPAPTDGTCCPQCTTETVPQCYECINGVIVAPNINCLNNETYNYETCRCECNCNNGFCRNVLTGACVPCPTCGVITGLYTCNGQPYNPIVAGCNQCINGQIVPIICAEGYISNPHFNPTLPISTTNPCCISLTTCDCESPNCPNEGDICTHIDSLGDCYCVNCSDYSCETTTVRCAEINGCECINEICQNSCPSCTNNVSIVEYCSPYYVEYKGCTGDYLKFKVYELINLLPISDCSYENYLSTPISNKTDITATFSTGSLQYNVTSSIFFENANLGIVSGETYILINKTNVQTLLLSVNKYSITTIYEFIFDDCLLADNIDPNTNLVIADNPRIFRESCKTIYGLTTTATSCPYNEYIWEFENSADETAAIELQNGKYIIIIPTSTNSEVCLTANLVIDSVICSQYEQCISYNSCIGGCSCDPCANSGSFLANIETVNNPANGTVTASASVLLNCNGNLNALLATCEPATENENCAGTIPDRNGTSPLPFSDYSDYIGNALTPCQIFGCSDVITGCEVTQEAPCGWLYDDSKLEVLWYNGANISVGFTDGSIDGKLCWGANYECGYYCDCVTVVKELTCNDYGINSVTLNCPPTYSNTNLGSILIDVDNFGSNYTVTITNCGETTPAYTTTSNLSLLTIPILDLSSLGTIVNGTCLDIKVVFITENLNCEYNEQLTYDCCITPTLINLSYECTDGLLTEIEFETDIAGNIATITITDIIGNVIYSNNQSTVAGINTHVVNGDINNAETVTITICDDSTTDCCVTNTIPVIECTIPCESYGINNVTLNCPLFPSKTDLGEITINVENFNNLYTVTITKCGEITPAYTTTSNLSTLTIPILDLSDLGFLPNGSCLDIKVTFLINGLNCEYSEQLTYDCCITPTLINLSYECVNGLITEVSFETDIAGNIATITITDIIGNVVYNNNQLTVIGTNTHVVVGNINNADTITFTICNNNTTDCCVTSVISGVNCQIPCEDYGINSVTLNCPLTYSNTDLGEIIIDVNNFSNPYTIEIIKCGETTPVYTTTSSLSLLTIPVTDLSILGTIANGSCLDIKVTFVVNNLDCEYSEQLTYDCCVIPELTKLSYECVDGLITEVEFETNIPNNTATITITNITGNVLYSNSQLTTTGINTHVVDEDVSNATTITITICDESTTNCCITNIISVVDCIVPCEVDIDAEYTCNGLSVDSLVITITSTVIPINVVVSNGSNSITFTNISSVITLNSTELATLNLQDNDSLTITANNSYPCSATITEIIDCSVQCNISADYTYRCENSILTELLLTVLNYYTSYNITGTLHWTSNTITPTIVDQTINVSNIVQDVYYITPPQNYPNNTQNCVYGTLTITDEYGCIVVLDISCELCSDIGDETYECVDGKCINTTNGFYTDLISCKNICEQIVPSYCGDVITIVANSNIVTERLFSVANLVNNANYYIDIAFGGKPESYEIYQVDANNNSNLLLKSPNLGCNCVIGCISLAGFWTNVSNLDNLGNYNSATVASVTNPFIFSGNSCGWSGYIANSGELLPYIPDDCTWIPHYDTNCIVNANRDYDTCGTCVIGNEETVNAKALGRMYFNYDSSYGNIFLIRVYHGTPTCNTGSHGVKFKLICEASDCVTCSGGVHNTSNIIPSGGGCNGGFDIEIVSPNPACVWVITQIRNNDIVPTVFYPTNTSGCPSFLLTQTGLNKYTISNAPAGSYIIDWKLQGNPTCTEQTVRIDLIP